jgi:hypothetical protein
MFNYLWRQVKRLAVLLPGLIVVYISVKDIFPLVHRRLPFAAAFLVTYLIGAYLLVPAIIRGWRTFFRAKHLPVYSVTPDGFASDPLNIGLIGSRFQLVRAMDQAGWSVAQPKTIGNIFTTIIASVLNHRYDGMPMSRLYLFGRKQDIGFELQRTDQGRGHRHHVRFWATSLSDIWSGPIAKKYGDQQLWVGAASRDIGIAFMRQSLQLVHSVHPDTNSERELIVRQLTKNRSAKLVDTIQLQRAYSLINRAWFSSLRTDGKMAILLLKDASRTSGEYA